MLGIAASIKHAFFCGSVKCNRTWPFVMDSSVSCYGFVV